MSAQAKSKKRKSLPAIVPESEVEKAFDDYLDACGYLRLVTNAGRVGPGRQFSSLGIPDRLVRWPKWRVGMWVAFEFKRPEIRDAAGNLLQKRGAIRPDQQALAEIGAIYIVDNVTEAIKILSEIDNAMGWMPGPIGGKQP